MDEKAISLLPELSHWSLMEAHAALRGSPARHESAFSWISPGTSWGSACYRVRAEPGALDGLRALEAKMRELECTVVTGPAARDGEKGQAETEAALVAAGFTFSSETTGMVLSPRSFKPATLPAGHVVEEPAARESLIAWAGLVSRNLFKKDDPLYAVSFAESASLLRDAGLLDVFLCRDGAGNPLSASASFKAGSGIGGVYFVATEPNARRRGLGAALTSLACARCIDNKIDPVALHATDIGRPVYEALGFRKVSAMRRYGVPLRD